MSLLLTGFPRIKDYGEINSQYSYICMTLHGTKVDFLKHYRETERDHNRIIGIGLQILKSIEKIHSIGYVHCDIKPQNILFDSSNHEWMETDSSESMSQNYVLIDFGISQPYMQNGKHIKKEKIRKFRGSLEFCAADVLCQYKPTRKHDIESLIYTILYLLRNKKTLWKCDYTEEDSMELGMSLKEKLHKLAWVKLDANPEEMCSGLRQSKEFSKLYEYIMEMGYFDKPDYQHITRM